MVIIKINYNGYAFLFFYNKGEVYMNNNINDKEILTVSQVSEYLQLSEMTTYKLVQEGRIPAFKIGRHWRVRKKDLTSLLDKLQNGERI